MLRYPVEDALNSELPGALGGFRLAARREPEAYQGVDAGVTSGADWASMSDRSAI